ncbi:MAG: M15 family metallopeptidase [Bacteroidota bacterium]
MSHIHSFFFLLLGAILISSCKDSISKDSEKKAVEFEQTEEITQDSSMVEVDSISQDLLLGRFDPAKDTSFEKLTSTHAAGSALGAYLNKECLAKFKEMHAAAKAEGITLTIRSATRNFFRQKQIWEAKWTGARKVGGKNLSKSLPDPAERASEILLFSSMPGTSRHHWGTDLDINSFENSYFESGKGLKEYTWLKTHAATYGFGQPYTSKGEDREFGYEEEKWHWSYLPIAKKYLAAYGRQIEIEDIKGFKGAEVAEELKVIERYVFGIAPECK